MRRLLKIEFVRFSMVGVLGFTINFVFLTLFYKLLHLPLFIAQIISAEIALFSNFLFHHHWTYKREAHKPLRTLIVQFHLTSWVAIVGTALLVTAGVHVFHLSYVIALAIAAAAALAWNFVWTKFVIWRKHTALHPTRADEPEHRA